MILFKEDWKKYPGAIPDYSTRNTSFLEFAATLHAMGVTNCLFPLALHDQRLQGVDPRDYENLTDDLKERIVLEINTNPWYFLREVLRIPASGVDGIPFRANRGSIAQWWARMLNIDIFMMQPRQTGKSVTADSQHLWFTMFKKVKATMMCVTRDKSLITQNVNRLKKMRALLPKYTWVPTKKDKDIETLFNYGKLENTIVFKGAQNDEENAKKALRGFTSELLHMDEGPYIRYVEHMLPDIAAAMTAAIDNARASGTNYGKLFTTTAGDLSLPHGAYMYGVYKRGCKFTEKMYDLQNRGELLDVIFKNTGQPVPQITMVFNHRMLGISDEKMWENINSAASTPEEIDKDFFLIWGKGGKSSIIDPAILQSMSSASMQPKYNELTEMGYVVSWYIDKEEISTYLRENKCILGVDTSDQIKGDSTAMVLINVCDLSIVATINVNDANIITTASWLADWLIKHETITLIIEKKSSAQTFIDTLLIKFMGEGINPYKRIWNHVIDNCNLDLNLYGLLRRGKQPPKFEIEKNRRHFGFNQTGNTRNLLYSQVLEQACSKSRYVAYDSSLVDQVSSLKIDENGRVDHISSKHDDLVMAWLLAHWVLYYGKNLDYYGIDSRLVMARVGNDGKQLTDDDQDDLIEIERLSNEINELMQQYNRETHPGLRSRIEHRITKVNQQLTDLGVEPKTLDGTIKDIEDHHKQKRTQDRFAYRR